jgi:hypothetical protein
MLYRKIHLPYGGIDLYVSLSLEATFVAATPPYEERIQTRTVQKDIQYGLLHRVFKN